ncbi:Golgin subfamily A member 7/ERF4 family-domain-containing protein [Nemania sp. NC0429]|nr:Golgin subfamily A member 7/ERF4 family-domain-containing protein [Nemania sp. NC0429]
MPLLEPAAVVSRRMDSANLFSTSPSPPSSPSSPLSTNLCRRFCDSWSPPPLPPLTRPRYRNRATRPQPRLRPTNSDRRQATSSVPRGIVSESSSSIASRVVAAASVALSSSRRLPTPEIDPRRQRVNSRDANVAVSPTQPRQSPANSSPRQRPPVNVAVPAPTTRARQHPRHQNTAQEPSHHHLNRPLPPLFSNRADSSHPDYYRLSRTAGTPGRLWNPTNSTPRLPPAIYTQPIASSRRRRPSTPPPPTVPFHHPTLDDTRLPDDQVAAGAGDYPLLTLPEQRQSRHLTPTPTRSSFQIEGRLNEGKRISLPSSVRHSYEIKPAPNAPVSQLPELETKQTSILRSGRERGQSVTKKGRGRAVSFGLVHIVSADQPAIKIDKGKGKAVMSSPNHNDPPRGRSTDLERGLPVLNPQQNGSTLSIPGGIGSAISSSNSSIIGDPNQPGLGDEWGAQHPCYPHLNPYVPLNSAEYKTTRIIRIRRDWLVAGDLAPTFSNMYPEILDPAGVPEQEFRRVIEKLNASLVPIFDPYNWRNILDGMLGVLSAWVWEDLGFTNVKTKLNDLEAWIDKWNAEMEKTASSEEGAVPPKIISLRRTGYMSLDFQIQNPEVSVSTSEPASRSGPAPEFETAA